MSVSLTRNGIPSIFSLQAGLQPVVQIMNVSLLGNLGRWRAHISDGDNYCSAVFSAPLTTRASTLKSNQIVRLDRLGLATPNGGNRQVVVIDGFTELPTPPGLGKIGNPETYPRAGGSIPSQVVEVQPQRAVEQQPVSYPPPPQPYTPSIPPSYIDVPHNQAPPYTHPFSIGSGNVYNTLQPHVQQPHAQQPQVQQQASHQSYPHHPQQLSDPYQQQPYLHQSHQPQQPRQPQQMSVQHAYQPGQHTVNQVYSNPYPVQMQSSAISHMPSAPAPPVHAMKQSNPYQQPQASPYAPSSRQGGGSVRINREHPPTPIRELSVYTQKWTVKARVSSKSEVKTFRNARGEGQLFSMEIVDANGDEMKCSCFGGAVDKFYDVLVPGGVFQFSKGSVKPANARFNPKGMYEITFDENSEIVVSAEDGLIPAVKFEGVKISSISTVGLGEYVDVAGVVYNASDVSRIVIKSTGQEKARRVLTIADDSCTGVDVTIWGERAESTSADYANHPIVFFKNCKVGDFGGRSLSLVSNSTIEFNPDHARTSELRNWWAKSGSSQQIHFLSSTGGGGDGSGVSDDKRETIEQIKSNDQTNLGIDRKPVLSHQVRATIIHIPIKEANIGANQSSLYYRACPHEIDDGRGGRRGCSKKVEQNGSGWICAEGHVSAAPEARFIMPLRIQDGSGDLFVRAFNEQARIIFGIDANVLDRASPEDLPLIQQEAVDKAVFKNYIFKLRSKKENHMDEERVNTTVVEVQLLTPAADARAMLPFIHNFVKSKS